MMIFVTYLLEAIFVKTVRVLFLKGLAQASTQRVLG